MEQNQPAVSLDMVKSGNGKKRKELTEKKRRQLEEYLEHYIANNGNGTQAYCDMYKIDYKALDNKKKAVVRKQAERLYTHVHFPIMLEQYDDHNTAKHKRKREDMLDVLSGIAEDTMLDPVDRRGAATSYLNATQGAALTGQRAGASVTLNPDGSLALNIAIENTSTAIDEFNRATGFHDDKKE